MGAAGATGAVALLWALLAAAPRLGAATALAWPNALKDFEQGGLPGLLETRKEGVHRDFRKYYRVVALDLLLVHHGFRPCESVRGDDEENLRTTATATEAFQVTRGLPVNFLSLDNTFWTNLIVHLRPGSSGAAVLALRWLLDATAHASRPPLWDAAAVQTHACGAVFDDSLLATLQASASAGACGASNVAELRRVGLSPDCWKSLLTQAEVTVAEACELRAPMANTFGVVWVVAWLAMSVAFAVTRPDGKCSDRPSGTTPGVFQSALHNCRRVVPLLAMLICQNLAAIGIWSFPHDLAKLVLVGLLISGGAIVVVYLAAARNHATTWIGKSLLEIFALTAGNVGALFLILLLPYVRSLWFVEVLALAMLFWCLVTMLLTRQHRTIRGALLALICLFGIAGPTLISIVAGLVNKTGLWLAAFAPTGLFAASLLSERLVGHFIVKHCEYPAETQWLLAIMFRLCIELVRFNTALTVLLLSLVADSGFWFLLLHLAQTLVFEVATRLPRHFGAAAAADPAPLPLKGAWDPGAPFTAAEIVLRVGAHPWVYRSRAVMFPIEVVLFLSHLCQLVFVGMPPGVGQGWWIFGLALIGAENVCHEAIGHLLDRYSSSAMPVIPWSQLSGHLLALMAGAGTALSTIAQFGSLWLIYAHHWAACFIDGGRRAGDLATATQATSVVRITGTVVLGVLALAVTIHAFLSWLGVFAKMSIAAVVPAEDTDGVPDPFSGTPTRNSSRTLSKSSSSRWLNGEQRYAQPQASPQNSGRLDNVSLDQSLSSSLKTEKSSDAPVRCCSRTWEHTLSALWDDDSSDEGGNSPRKQPVVQGGSSADTQGAAAGAAPAPGGPARVPSTLSSALGVDDVRAKLLQELGIHEDREATPVEEEQGRASPNAAEACTELLREVLAATEEDPPQQRRSPQAQQAARTPSPLAAAPQPQRHLEPSVSADPLSSEDLVEIAEIEAELHGVPMANTHQKADSAAALSSDGVEEDDVKLLLQRTLDKDDLNGLLDALPPEPSAQPEEKAGRDAAGASGDAGEAPVAAAPAAAQPDAGAEAAPEGSASEDQARAAEEAARAAEEEARAAEEQRVAVARAVAQEALGAAARGRSRAEIERCLAEAQAAGVPAEEAAEAKRVLAEIEQEEEAAKSAAATEALRRAAQEALAAAVQQRSRGEIEQRLETAKARGVAEEHLVEAQRVVDELLAEEKAAAEAAAAESNRAKARADLHSAMQRRSQYELAEAIVAAKAIDVEDDAVRGAEGILQELEDEERREFAASALAAACEEEDLDEIRSKIQKAREAAVEPSQVAAAEAKLEALQSREAARAHLQDALATKSGLTLAAQIARLRAALDGAKAAAVPAGELQAPGEHLASLEAQQRREVAAVAMAEALAAQDIERTREALVEARAAGVEESQVAKVEQGLRNLEEELELAHDKVKLLRRKIENAMEAKNLAEMAAESAEVENMLGEQGVTQALRSIIEEAKKMRLVSRNEIQKAEAVLQEVTADLKRILLAKQKQEQQLAEERLAEDMEAARRERPLTHLVLERLQEAITASKVFQASTKDAEALLATLTADHEREKQAAVDGLARAIGAMDAAGIRAGVELCRSLLLAETVRTSMQQLRGIVSSELATAREAEREERLQKLPTIEALVNTMRALGDLQLRQFHNDLQDLKGALRVFCRVRPLNTREKNLGDTVGVSVVDPFTVSVQGPSGDPQPFAYDAIFGPTATQAEVFSECRSLIQSAFDGYNVTIFSYGQTGAGKTWTLYGSGSEPGISPRTCEEVFEMVARDSDRLEFDVSASMVELYCNDLRDLLNKDKDPPKLEFKSAKQPDGSLMVRLDGVHETKVESSEDLARVVMTGLSHRKTKKTNMNADSSRSHLMLVISFKVSDRASGRSRHGKITIVDLAGSERLAKSGVTGEGQKEAIEINKSLTALGDVMMAFTSRSRVIPYRNHKLTQLMQDSLGGSAKTLMFVNISPATSNADETVNALKYASRARCIENDVKKHK